MDKLALSKAHAWYRNDPKELDEFYQMYESGKYHVYEIAEWFGISISAANNCIKNYDRSKIRKWQKTEKSC